MYSPSPRPDPAITIMRELHVPFLFGLLGLATPGPFIGPLHAQDDEAVVRWYDVRALSNAHVEDRGVDVRPHLESSFLDQLEPDSYDVQVEDLFSPEDYGWEQLLLDALGDEWPDDQVFIDERNGMLRVEGTAQTQAEVRTILAELSEELLRTARVEFFALRPADVPRGSGSVLSAAEVDALLAEAEPLDYAVASAPLGQRARLGRSGTRSALVDYDVEVAQYARMADPIVTVLYEGTELGVLVLARDDGGFFVRLWGRRGKRAGEPREVRLAGLGDTPIELPSMWTSVSAASAGIPDGGGLLLGEDWSENGLWLVRVAGDGSDTADSGFVPLGELSAVPLVLGMPEPTLASPSGGFPEVDFSLSEQLGDVAGEPSFAVEDLFERLMDERDEHDLGGSLLLLGSDLYVRRSPALLEHVRTSVDAIRGEFTGPTVEIDLRLGLLDRATAIGLVRDGAGADLLEHLDHRVLGTARLGDTLVVMGGKESYYLKDHDVEIAQGSAIDDPVVANVFDGIALWCLPNRLLNGDLSLLVELAVQRLPGDVRPIPTIYWEPRDPTDASEENIPTGTFHDTALIEREATTRAGVRSRIELQNGSWKLLTASGIGGEERMLVAMVRATSAGVR